MTKKKESIQTVTELPKGLKDTADLIDSGVSEITTSKQITGFEKAFLLATATKKIKNALTKEYMEPIMELQGSKIGFLTDKDREGGYPMTIVKDCLIEAVLTGIQPFGNQFNIIGGNMYITKEGFGYLLKNIKGLRFAITPHIPQVKGESAIAKMDIRWEHGENKGAHTIEFPVKINKYQSVDAVVGKGTRKARAWLYNHITDSEFSDGDVSDFTDAQVVESKPPAPANRKSGMSSMFDDQQEDGGDDNARIFD